MRYDIHGDRIMITLALKHYIEEKLNKLNKYFENQNNITARIVLKVRGHNQTIEVTIPTTSFTLRNEETNLDLYAAIDIIVDKIERQLIKNKTKMLSKSLKVPANDFKFDNIDEDEGYTKEIVVRRKKLETKPMSEEEAILQMNMLGHDFFIYRDAMTREFNVLYKRKDGNYGIIETK
ncbi:MAG: ribosome-associated translation inhibitor RaiA [Bacilli bacterium]|jgi:putative sigma-54 modulation protein